jgi:hypothetical protein
MQLQPGFLEKEVLSLLLGLRNQNIRVSSKFHLNGSRSFFASLPVDAICADGILAVLDNSSVVLCCVDANGIANLWIGSVNEWIGISNENNPLYPWTIQFVIEGVTPSFNSSLFLGSTVEHSTFFFTFQEGTVSQYICYTGQLCSTTSSLLITAGLNWLCAEETDEYIQQRQQRKVTTNLDSPPSGPQWPMFQVDAQHTGRGANYWNCTPSFQPTLALHFKSPYSNFSTFSTSPVTRTV